MTLSFEPVSMEKQTAYKTALARCAQIASDYSFTNIWGWGEEYGLEWAWHENLVWLRQTRPEHALWAPVGNWSEARWSSLLPTALKVSPRIIRVPEALLNTWRTSGAVSSLKAMETRGQWDYLYSKQALVDLKGNSYHKKKNLVNQFKKNYDWTFSTLGPDVIKQALAMQEDWCAWRDCESHETLSSENRAIARILDHWQALEGIAGGALRVDQTMVAYTIGETMPDKTLVIHFEKGNPDYKGSYQAINQLFLENSADDDVDTVNREQDLGDEGLRKAKLSYHPIAFVRKYEIVL